MASKSTKSDCRTMKKKLQRKPKGQLQPVKKKALKRVTKGKLKRK